MKNNLFLCATILATLAGSLRIYFHRKRKPRNQLLIIGNGFDIYHGISSRYLQFREYLRHKDKVVFDSLKQYLSLDGDDEWNELESNLANLDADELLDEMRIYLGDSSSDEWREYMNHDFQYEVNKVTDRLGEKMKQHFLSWILQLDTHHQSSNPKLALPLNTLYLNFNYTNSLEKIYGIAEKNICYIHGKAVNASSEVILGHGWEGYVTATEERPLTLQDQLEGDVAPTEGDWRYSEAKQYIQNYFASTYKNASQIIQRNKHFFRSLKGIQEIHVLGHSMSRVDRKYFEAITANVDAKKLKWTISYHTNNDIKNATETLTDAGVNMNLLIFKRLQDFFSRQINLF